MGARPHGVPLAAPRALGQVAHCGPTLNALSNELLSPAKFHKGACTLPGLLPWTALRTWPLGCSTGALEIR